MRTLTFILFLNIILDKGSNNYVKKMTIFLEFSLQLRVVVIIDTWIWLIIIVIMSLTHFSVILWDFL